MTNEFHPFLIAALSQSGEAALMHFSFVSFGEIVPRHIYHVKPHFYRFEVSTPDSYCDLPNNQFSSGVETLKGGLSGKLYSMLSGVASDSHGGVGDSSGIPRNSTMVPPEVLLYMKPHFPSFCLSLFVVQSYKHIHNVRSYRRPRIQGGEGAEHES